MLTGGGVSATGGEGCGEKFLSGSPPGKGLQGCVAEL